MSDNNQHALILDAFLETCLPVTDPLLGFLKPDEHVFQGPPDPDRVLASLAEKFSRDELLASGVALETEAGLDRR